MTRRPIRKIVQIVVVGIVVGIVMIFLTGIILFRSFLRSPKTLRNVGARIAGEVNTPAGLLPFKWKGMSVSSEGLVIQSKPGQTIRRLEARGVTAQCNFFTIWQKVITVAELDVDHLQVGSGEASVKRMTGELSSQPELHAPDTSQSSFKLHVIKTMINACDIYLGKTANMVDSLKNTTLTLRTVNSGLEIEGKNGTLKEATFPEMTVDHFSLRYAKPDLTIKEGILKLEGGTLAIHGIYDTDDSNVKLAMAFTEVPIGPFLPEDWRNRFTANFTANADMVKDISKKGMLQFSGTIHCPHARLEHYDAQKKIASLTHKPEFNKLTFTTLQCSFSCDHDKLEVRKFAAEVEGLLMIEGAFTVEKGTIDATFNVGIDPSALEPIPGSRDKVFTRMHDKYAWTVVKLNGPIKHPSEDLSPRLLTAAKEAVIIGFFKFVPKTGIQVITTLAHLF